MEGSIRAKMWASGDVFGGKLCASIASSQSLAVA